MGERPSIPVESWVTRQAEATDAGNGGRGRTSSGRVVHEPGRWPRWAAAVGIVGLVAGGLVGTLRGGDTGRAGDDEASDPSVPPDAPQAETRAAFNEAMLRFRDVDSFAYRGSVRTDGQHPFEPTPWTAGDVAVEGGVVLTHGLSRDVAVDDHGRAVETLTSGTTVWRRSAPDATALGSTPWEVRLAPGYVVTVAPREVQAPSRFPLDAATVTRLVLSAGNPRGEAPDAAGRRVIRATLPGRGPGAGYRPLGGADVLLTLDDRGGVAGLMVTWPAVDPHLVLGLEISGHNEPQGIAPPDTGPVGLRRIVPVGALEAAGLQPLELGRVPAGWRLVGAASAPVGIGPGHCSMLSLTYANPAVVEDFMWLEVASAGCSRGFGRVTGGRRQSLTVGRFDGSVVVSSALTTGAVFDGSTVVRFTTDLALGDVVTLLESLRPFDPAAEPASLPAASP